jgi:hypothetical protein
MRSSYLPFSIISSAALQPVMRFALALLVAQQLACGSAPVQEMSEARQAIEAARVAGAEQHAPASYERARSLLKEAEHMLNQHHFSRARASAAQARDAAIVARETARKADDDE